MRQVLFAAVAGSALFAASPASAGNLEYLFTGIGKYAGFWSSWEQDSNPTPISANTDEYTQIAISNYQASAGSTYTSWFYWPVVNGGGLTDQYGLSSFSLWGPQLYTGTESNPVFSAGSYAMADYFGDPAGTITVTDAPAPAPVPGAGLLSLAFFALVGLGAKARPFLKAAFNRGTRARAPGGGRGSRHPRRP